MIRRLPFRLAAAAGLWLSQMGVAAEPAKLALDTPVAPVSADQRLADGVAQRLAKSNLRGYSVEIVCQDGTVDVVGSAGSDAQRDEVLKVVRTTPGVTLVRDGIAVSDGIVPVNGMNSPGPLGAPTPLPPGAFAGGPGSTDPMPLNGGFGPAYDLHPPKLPPYAWPTYAPHNNYSRVAYPEQYPYSSFPFIGPFYPFPKVPLGWRAVKLEWEDGHWWYGRNKQRRDFWQVRYW